MMRSLLAGALKTVQLETDNCENWRFMYELEILLSPIHTEQMNMMIRLWMMSASRM